jgi:transposase-like protein
MPSQREQLRARIAEVLKQEPRKRRYGADLKRAIVDYAFARQDERATIREIAEELGLSVWLLGKWLRHAHLRLEKGKIPFEPGEPLPMPWLESKAPAADPSAAGSSPLSMGGGKRGDPVKSALHAQFSSPAALPGSCAWAGRWRSSPERRKKRRPGSDHPSLLAIVPKSDRTDAWCDLLRRRCPENDPLVRHGE